MAPAPPANAGFSPLDEHLALLPGQFSPAIQEMLVRLSAWMPFAHAAAFMRDFAHVAVSEGTAQRLSYAAGATAVVQEALAVQQLLTDPTPVSPPNEPLLISMDGAHVPLMGGMWTEAKTMVIGTVVVRPGKDGEPETQTTALSSFSRVAEATVFASQATAEAHRRGVTVADRVVAVTDGAEWIQGMIDLHCPDAVRILDFPHAAQRLSAIAATVWREGDPAGVAWFATQRHTLRHSGPQPVLAAIALLAAAHPNAAEDMAEHVAYLTKRVAMLDYPAFVAAGWPIGSGCVESANKLVVEARLKGAGKHWAAVHLNPMLALRNIVCNERWPLIWPQIARSLRAEARSAQRQAQAPPPQDTPAGKTQTPAPPTGKTQTPAPNHPWRKPTLAGGRAYLDRQRAAKG
jgi:hypothetical protein